MFVDLLRSKLEDRVKQQAVLQDRLRALTKFLPLLLPKIDKARTLAIRDTYPGEPRKPASVPTRAAKAVVANWAFVARHRPFLTLGWSVLAGLLCLREYTEGHPFEIAAVAGAGMIIPVVAGGILARGFIPWVRSLFKRQPRTKGVAGFLADAPLTVWFLIERASATNDYPYVGACWKPGDRQPTLRSRLFPVGGALEDVNNTPLIVFSPGKAADRDHIPYFACAPETGKFSWVANSLDPLHPHGLRLGDAFLKRLDDANARRPLLAVADTTRELETITAEVVKLEAMLSSSRIQPWSALYLRDNVQTELDEVLASFITSDSRAPRGLLLHGPAGTGKTRVARAFADASGAQLFDLSLADLKRANVGESAQYAKDVWDHARASASGAIIFLDECEAALADPYNGKTDGMVLEIVNTFLPQLDGTVSGGNVLFIGATNRKEVLDARITGRLKEVEIALPDAIGRAAILGLEYKTAFGLVPAEELLRIAVDATQSFSGRQLRTLVRELPREVAQHTAAHIVPLAERQRRQSGHEVASDASWDNLILPAETKKSLKEICLTLEHAERLKARGFTVPNTLLLIGPPGTGKTEIARTLANESKMTFIGISVADIKAGFIGQSGLALAHVFQKARAASPAIVFFDEIDAVMPERGGNTGDTFTNDLVAEMLTQMDGVRQRPGQVFVLAASNKPDVIDSAIRSRFADHWTVGLPDESARGQLVMRFIRGKRVDFDHKGFAQHVALHTEGWSGRDLLHFVRSAEKSAISRALLAGNPDDVCLSVGDFK